MPGKGARPSGVRVFDPAWGMDLPLWERGDPRAVTYAEHQYRDRVNSWTIYPSSNDLGIPDLHAETWVPERLVAFQAKGAYDTDAAVHFFLNDYRFERLWATPSKYLDPFTAAGAVLSPDFSVYRELPLAMQVWQTYRNRWLGAHLQAHGFRVIPTVGWATPAEFFYFGLPKRSVLAIATTGVRRDQESMDHFLAGFERLAELEPAHLLVYGSLAGLVNEPSYPVSEFPTFTERFVRDGGK